MIFKFVTLLVIVLSFIVVYTSKFFISESRYKNDPMKRIRILTRIKFGCILLILIMLLICMFI